MKKNILAAALLSALTSTAMAEGFYGAVDIGQATFKDACSGLQAGFACSDSDTAIKLGGGYQFTPNVGVEASYGTLGRAKGSGIDTSAGFPIAISAEAKFTTLQISATGTFPIANSFSLIGKLGIARTTLDSSATGTALGRTVSSSISASSTKFAYGIGAQYDFAKSVGVRAQYENLGEVGDANTTGTAKVSLISAGIVFKF